MTLRVDLVYSLVNKISKLAKAYSVLQIPGLRVDQGAKVVHCLVTTGKTERRILHSVM
jgi:hypothetical protein